MKLSCLCLLFVVNFAAAFGGPHYYGMYEGHGELYDSSKEKCCRGRAFPKTRATFILCCGNTTYDITEEICCQGTPKPLDAGTRTACCGSTTYDVKTSLCCMGRVAKPPKGSEDDLEHYECRGKKAVDTRDTAQNELEPMPQDDNDHYGSYGYGRYPPRRFGPIDHSFPSFRNRCNGTKFNTTTHMCCNDTIKETSVPNSACCGEDQHYNRTKQVCCKNPDGVWQISPKPVPTMGPYDSPYYYDMMGSSCCGGVGYDRMTDMCCEEKLHKIPVGNNRWEYQCCGSEIIDSSTHSCCDGKNAQEKGDDSESCCGNTTYSYRKEMCCYHKEETKVFEKPEGSRSQCCAGQVISTKTHLCCYDYRATDGNYETLLEKATPTHQCCGNSSYDPLTQLCCGNTISPLEGEGATRQQCCGEEVYNPDSQMCCDQKVLDIIDESKRSCCSIYASDDYMTGCFGMNRPQYYDYPSAYGGYGGAKSESSEEEKKSEESTTEESTTEIPMK